MKSTNRILFLTLSILFFIGGVNAQQRYKHKPRVKVEANKPVYERNESKVNVVPTTLQTIQIEESNVQDISVNSDVISVSNNTDEVLIHQSSPKVKVKSSKNSKISSNKKKIDVLNFTQQLQENSKLMKVKDVKKSKMEIWILLYILFYVVSIIFLILLILAIFLYWGLVAIIVFGVLAALFAIAASVLLFLGRAGVL